MKINEGWVVYLFSRFHEQLGFEKILQIQTAYPDCYALKDGKEVSIEFEAKSYSLRNHLLEREFYPIEGYELLEKDGKFLFYHKSSSGPVTDIIRYSYPKSEFRLEKFPDHYFQIYKRKLDLDYCICWEHKLFSTVDPAWFEGVKIIELKEFPFIQQFMKEKGYLPE